MSNSTNLGFTYLEASQAQKHVTVNEALRVVDAVIQLSIIDRDLTTPPSLTSPTDDGKVYIPASGATGDWSGHVGEIAFFVDDAWQFVSPKEGWRGWVQDENVEVHWSGSAWALYPAQLESFVIACSDETTALATGTGVASFRMPYAFNVTAVRASVTTAPTGAALQVDINEGGGSILSTKLSIDAGEKTSTTAATAAVISDAALADDALITIDIDQVGSTVTGAGLKVTLIGNRV